MRRGSDYYNRQNGWDTTSHDYHSHVSRMERMPSVLPDVPHYPNVHVIFNNNNNKAVYEEEEDESRRHQQQKKHHDPKKGGYKKVQFVEQEEVAEIEKNGNHVEVYEERVDVEADGFIQQKRKNFELCKWATYKMT